MVIPVITLMASSLSFSSEAQNRPNFGFLIVSRPYTAAFQPIGPYHMLSYLSPAGQWLVTADKLTVCVWLGPGKRLVCTFVKMLHFNSHCKIIEELTIDIPDTSVFLIWPEKKIILRVCT